MCIKSGKDENRNYTGRLAGLPIKDLCYQYGFSEASRQIWRSQFGG